MPARTWKALRAISCICERAVFFVATGALINRDHRAYIQSIARNGPVGARGRETDGAPAYTKGGAVDLNQLYFDHQISLMRANATSSARLRLIHGRNAEAIARSIERIRRASGATDFEQATHSAH